MTWSGSLLPLAVAVSAGSLALHPRFNPSLCDAPDAHNRRHLFSFHYSNPPTFFFCRTLSLFIAQIESMSSLLLFVD